MDKLNFPALHLHSEPYIGVLTVIKSDILDNLVRVNQRIEDKDEGYQRAFSIARAKAIGKYINDGNVLSGVIIIALDHAEYDFNLKEIIIPSRPDAGWVVDGQHRLQGAAKYSDIKPDVAVLAYVKPPLDFQIEQFITINKEHKGVSSSLYIDLLKKLPRQLKPTEILNSRAHDLAEKLRKTPTSPFYNRIVATTAPREGQISLTNFVRKVVPLIREGGKLQIYHDETRASVFSNLFSALEYLYPTNTKIFYKTVGFGAIVECIPEILERASMLAGDLDWTKQSIINLFNQIQGFDFGSWSSLGSGSAAEKSAAADLRETLKLASIGTSEPKV